MDIYGFYRGDAFEAYEYLGAHITDEGTLFRTYAPNDGASPRANLHAVAVGVAVVDKIALFVVYPVFVAHTLFCVGA